MAESQPTLNKDSTTSIPLIPGHKTESKECDPGFIYIPLSLLNTTVDTRKQADNRTDKKLIKLIDGVPSSAKILNKSSHVILYDNRTRNAAWVFETLNEQTIKGEAERTSTYKIDEDIHEYYRAPESINPYSETDFDRGHLAAANNHKWNQEAMNDTHLLSNITPQHEKLNRRTWLKLENHCRRFIKSKEYQNVYVYTGPLYCPESDDEEEYEVQIIAGKAVPTHFFKVIIKEKTKGEQELECYKMPNRELPKDAEINDYTADLEVIEKLSGLVFSEKSQETESKRVTVHMSAEEKKRNKNRGSNNNPRERDKERDAITRQT